MNQFNLGQFLTKVIDYSISNIRGNSTESTPKPPPSAESFSQNLVKPQGPQPQIILVNTLNIQAMPLQTMQYSQMNHIEGLERALYVKDLMNLPKNLQELIANVQKTITAQVQTAASLQAGISINQIALLLQQNGKEAVNKLIMEMANASKLGITDLSQIKDTMKLINACVSSAGQNSDKTIKSLMLLYLPWLPLQNDVDFEIEMGSPEEDKENSENSITIMISTQNYGNVKATLVLSNGNSVTVLINCCEVFPKEELLKRLKADGTSHSLQSSIVFEQKSIKKSENATRQAKIDISNSSIVNPFLLLMSHSVIRHTLELDRAKQ